MIQPTRTPRSRPADRDDDLMPVYEMSPIFGFLVDAPVAMVPLYAVLAVLHQALSGKPVGSCVPTSHQISGALRHLGFTAEPMAACATVYRITATFAEVSEVGVWKRPPIVLPDGTTTGHMVVWTPSFAQLIDATLVQDPTLLAAARDNPLYSIPVLASVPCDLGDLVEARPLVTLDEHLRASWVLIPEWTSIMDPVLDGEAGTAVTRGALALATSALDLIHDLGEERDLNELRLMYPKLGRLLAGQQFLPDPSDARAAHPDGA